MNAKQFGKNEWLVLVLFGLVGQIAWSVENMYFNLFVFETVAPSLTTVTLMVQLSGIAATLTTLVAGTLSENIGILDLAISDAVVQHDMDTSPLGDPVGLLSGINIVKLPASKRLCEAVSAAADKMGIRYERGVIASGDQFICDAGKKSYIKSNFDAIACEMEGGSIGHVCFVNGVDFVVIRSISDNASGEANMEYPEMVKRAAAQSEALVIDTLERL